MDYNRAILEDKSINPILLDKSNKVYICSTGVPAKKILYTMLQNNVRIWGFVKKGNEVIEKIYNIPVFSIEELKGESFVLIADDEEENLCADGTDKIYLIHTKTDCKTEFYFGSGIEKKCNAALMLSMVLSRCKGKRNFFFIKQENFEFWENLIITLGLDTDQIQFISLHEEDEKIYEVAYYNPDEIMILIACFDMQDISVILEEMGLKHTQHFVFIDNSFSGHVTDKYYGFDWMLGNTYIQTETLPGFYIHGGHPRKQPKIVILGNSATDPLFYPQKAWPEFLYEKYVKQGIEVSVYNGAITDYSSSNEVSKLVRDVVLIQPNIVISYSGFIDFRQYLPNYPYVNLNLMRTCAEWEKESQRKVIHGVIDQRSAYDRWLDNEKIMNCICEGYNIKFYGILQPWLGSENVNVINKLEEWNENYWKVSFPQFDKILENAHEFKERIKSDTDKYGWLFNCTDIFAEIEDEQIFYDSIHVNEIGNKIVADAIWKIINRNFD